MGPDTVYVLVSFWENRSNAYTYTIAWPGRQLAAGGWLAAGWRLPAASYVEHLCAVLLGVCKQGIDISLAVEVETRLCRSNHLTWLSTMKAVVGSIIPAKNMCVHGTVSALTGGSFAIHGSELWIVDALFTVRKSDVMLFLRSCE
jgi:hypothetical protein